MTSPQFALSSKKIVIDGRLKKDWGGGIATYISALASRLPLEFVTPHLPIYSLREQLFFPFFIPSCDLFWSPHFNVPCLPIRAKYRVVTIHDLYHLDHHSQYGPLKRKMVKQLISQAIQRSDLILTVSHFSKRRILHHFSTAHVEVVYPGSDHLLAVEPCPVEGVPNEFYLFVGSNKPHKNRKFLKGLPLVEVLGQYTRGELKWLYTRAQALIFPSIYEGFGLPPLEAMSLACPVLASNVASIPEVCKGAALYFDPYDRTSLERCIDDLPYRREELMLRGNQRALSFTWDRSAKRHRELFSSLLGCDE